MAEFSELEAHGKHDYDGWGLGKWNVHYKILMYNNSNGIKICDSKLKIINTFELKWYNFSSFFSREEF